MAVNYIFPFYWPLNISDTKTLFVFSLTTLFSFIKYLEFISVRCPKSAKFRHYFYAKNSYFFDGFLNFYFIYVYSKLTYIYSFHESTNKQLFSCLLIYKMKSEKLYLKNIKIPSLIFVEILTSMLFCQSVILSFSNVTSILPHEIID